MGRGYVWRGGARTQRAMATDIERQAGFVVRRTSPPRSAPRSRSARLPDILCLLFGF